MIEFGDGLAARVRPGPGERVLWIHGYTMDSSTWEDLWALLPGWHHVGMDLPGHGASRAIRPGEDLRTLALLIGRAALNSHIHHVVALSFGTMVALQIAIEYPEGFRSLVLGAPAVAGGPIDEEIGQRYRDLARLLRERGPGAHMATLWMQAPPDTFTGCNGNPELIDRLFAVIRRHQWLELRDGSMRSLTQPPQRKEDLRRIRAATLVTVGTRELPAFERCAELIESSVPSCRRVNLPRRGHLCLLEKPRQVAPFLRAHLRRHSQTGV